MLNPQKRNLVLATIAVFALIGVIGVVAKKKPGTSPSTETPSESSHALGTPDAPGTPQLSQPALPGGEPGSESNDNSEVGQNGSTNHETVAGHKSGAVPGLTLAMLSPGERTRIEKEYPEFKNSALGGRTAPGHDESAEVSEGADQGGHKGSVQAKNAKAAHDQQAEEVNTQLPNLTLAMLSPAERERVQKKYPELFNEKTGSGNGIQNGAGGGTDNGYGGTTNALAPIPTKPGQPLVLLQPGMPGHPDTPISQQPHTGSEIAQAPKPEPAVDSCYTVTYHHKHPGMRAGDESCAHHKNLIRIHAAEGLKLNPKTVCIKVNGTPVKSTQLKGKNDFIIGVVVGVDTAVTARFCTGKFRCNEDCKVPRDEFLDSIAGSTGDLDSDDSQKLAIAVWDKEDPNDKEANAKLAGDMQKGLKDLDEVAKAASEGYTLFQDWTADQQQFACQNHQAQGPAVDDEQDHEKPHRKVASKR